MTVVEDLQRHGAIWARDIVSPVDGRIPAMAEHCVDDVALEPFAK
jgi:hypothetical protein